MSCSEELFALMRERRSIRDFQQDPVDEATLLRLVEAASWAPSAGNRQDWFFSIVTDPTRKAEMGQAVRTRWREIIAANRDLGVIDEVKRYAATFDSFTQAPAVVVVSARKPDALQRHMLGDAVGATVGSATSAAMAAQNLMLAAHALGLGSCCMTGALAAREELARLIGLEGKQAIICLVALGKPANTPSAPARKPVAEIARLVK